MKIVFWQIVAAEEERKRALVLKKKQELDTIVEEVNSRLQSRRVRIGWFVHLAVSSDQRAVTSSLKDNYLSLADCNIQQIKEIRSKTQAENLATNATSKRVWIRPMYSASVSFS